MDVILPILAILLSGIERFSINFGYTITPIFIAALVTIFFVCVNPFYRSKIYQLPRVFVLIGISIPVAAFLSIIFSFNKLQALGSSVYTLLFIAFAFCLTVILKEMWNKRIGKFLGKEWIFLSILSSMFLFSLYALIQYIRFTYGLYPDILQIHIPRNTALSPLDFLTQHGSAVKSNIAGTKVLRPNSGFNDVNTSAGFLLAYIPLSLYILWYFFSKRIERIYMVSSIYAATAIILSGIAFVLMSSRGSLIALACITVFAILIYISTMSFRIKVVACIFALIFLLCGVSYYFTHTNMVDQRLYRVYQSEYSAQAHIEYTQSALREFLQRPLTGGGVGSFTSYFQYEEKKGIVKYHDSVDNPPLYIRQLGEEGIIGLCTNMLLYMFAISIAMKKIYAKNQSTEVVIFTSLLLFGLVSLLIGNIFHAYFSLFFTAVYLGLYFSLLI